MSRSLVVKMKCPCCEGAGCGECDFVGWLDFESEHTDGVLDKQDEILDWSMRKSEAAAQRAQSVAGA